MEVTSQLAQNLEAMAPFYTGQDSEAEAEQDFRPVPADYVITQVEIAAVWRIFQKKIKNLHIVAGISPKLTLMVQDSR